jgi:proteic killer suppression protein
MTSDGPEEKAGTSLVPHSSGTPRYWHLYTWCNGGLDKVSLWTHNGPVMNFRFDDGDLEKLYTDPKYVHGLPPAVVAAFHRRMVTIRSAPDERFFYGLKSLHFEKLKGARSLQHSMKLNDQWRLVVELEGKGPNKVVAIISIEDYH